MDNEAQSISIYVWDVEGTLVGVRAASTVLESFKTLTGLKQSGLMVGRFLERGLSNLQITCSLLYNMNTL